MRTVCVNRTGAVSCWASSARRRSACSKRGGGRRQERHRGACRSYARQASRAALGGGRHHRRVERAVDVEQPGLDAARAGEVEQAVDAAVQAGGDDLAGAVVVGRPDLAGLAASASTSSSLAPSRAAIDPGARATTSSVAAPRSTTSRRASLEARGSEATRAEYSPSEWPIAMSPPRRRARARHAKRRPTLSAPPAGSAGGHQVLVGALEADAARGRSRARRWPPRTSAARWGRHGAAPRPCRPAARPGRGTAARSERDSSDAARRPSAIRPHAGLLAATGTLPGGYPRYARYDRTDPGAARPPALPRARPAARSDLPRMPAYAAP